jgi:hypothetical protein
MNEVVDVIADVESSVFDSDPSNNRVQVTGETCTGQILSRSAPASVQYAPTATEEATQTLRLAMINTADDQSVEIRRIRLRDIYTNPLFGSPLQIRSITPQLPARIEPGDSQLFRVATFVAAGGPAKSVQRPYFTFRARCTN